MKQIESFLRCRLFLDCAVSGALSLHYAGIWNPFNNVDFQISLWQACDMYFECQLLGIWVFLEICYFGGDKGLSQRKVHDKKRLVQNWMGYLMDCLLSLAQTSVWGVLKKLFSLVSCDIDVFKFKRFHCGLYVLQKLKLHRVDLGEQTRVKSNKIVSALLRYSVNSFR